MWLLCVAAPDARLFAWNRQQGFLFKAACFDCTDNAATSCRQFAGLFASTNCIDTAIASSVNVWAIQCVTLQRFILARLRVEAVLSSVSPTLVDTSVLILKPNS